jgi:hypothetical protein
LVAFKRKESGLFERQYVSSSTVVSADSGKNFFHWPNNHGIVRDVVRESKQFRRFNPREPHGQQKDQSAETSLRSVNHEGPILVL